MKKHAYLIMVHKNNYVLEKLLQSLDCALNDIFIHVDTKCSDFGFDHYRGMVKYAGLFYTPNRFNVTWGGYSQIQTEMLLLRCAYEHDSYTYYHFLSGQDLPLKSQDELHRIFSKNTDLCYVNCVKVNTETELGAGVYSRTSYYRYLYQYRRQIQNKWYHHIFDLADKCIVGVQKYILKIDRNIGCELWYGTTSFSLTENAVKVLLDSEKEIQERFRYTCLADEVFLQTVLMQNGFGDKIVASKRMIEFDHNDTSHPIIWTISDYEKLLSSGAFFARKFDETVDKEIIDKISSNVSIN